MNKLFHLKGGFNLNKDNILSNLAEILSEDPSLGSIDDFSFDDEDYSLISAKISSLFDMPLINEALDRNEDELERTYDSSIPGMANNRNNLISKLEEKELELQAKNEEIERLRRQPGVSSEEIEMMKKRLEDQQNEFEKKRSEQREAFEREREDATKPFEQQIERLRGELENLKVEREQQEQQIKDIKENQSNLEQEYKRNEETIKSEYDSRIQELINEKDQLLNSGKSDIKKLMQEKDKQIKSLNKQKEDELSKAFKMNEKKLKEAKKESEKEINAIKKESESQLKQIKKLENNLEESQTIVQKLTQNEEDSKTRLISLEKQLEVQKADIMKKEKEIEQSNKINTELIDSQKEELENLKTDNEKFMTKLKEEMETQRGEFASLELEKVELEKARKVLEESVEKLKEKQKEELEQFNIAKEQLLDEKNKMEEELSQSRSKISEMDEQLAKSETEIMDLSKLRELDKAEQERINKEAEELKAEIDKLNDEEEKERIRLEREKEAEMELIKQQNQAREEEFDDIISLGNEIDSNIDINAEDLLREIEVNKKGFFDKHNEYDNKISHINKLEELFTKVKSVKEVQDKYTELINTRDANIIEGTEGDLRSQFNSTLEAHPSLKDAYERKLEETAIKIKEKSKQELIEKNIAKLNEYSKILDNKYNFDLIPTIEKSLLDAESLKEESIKLNTLFKKIGEYVNELKVNQIEINLLIDEITKIDKANITVSELDAMILKLQKSKHYKFSQKIKDAIEQLNKDKKILLEKLCKGNYEQFEKWIQLIKNILTMWEEASKSKTFITVLNNRSIQKELTTASKKYKGTTSINDIIKQYKKELDELSGFVEKKNNETCQINKDKYDDNWASLLAINAEDIGGAVRTYIRYRDVPYNKPTYILVGYPDEQDKMEAAEKRKNTCIFVNSMFEENACKILRFGREKEDSLIPNDPTKSKLKNSSYGPFTEVFNEKSKNSDVYNGIKGVFDQIKDANYNVTLFGYGFSGSGKTYTLLNSSEEELGITQQYFKDNENNIKNIECEVFEIAPYHTQSRMIYYKKSETSYDFKEVSYSDWRDGKGKFNINPDNIKNDITVIVKNIEKRRIKALRIATTPNNPESSRGHFFLQFNIKFKGKVEKPKFVICDMAGSENTSEIKESFFRDGLNKRDEILKDEKFNFDFPIMDSEFKKQNLGKITFNSAFNNPPKPYDQLRFISRKIEFADNIEEYLEFYLPDAYNSHRDFTKFNNTAELGNKLYSNYFELDAFVQGGSNQFSDIRNLEGGSFYESNDLNIYQIYKEWDSDFIKIFSNEKKNARLFTKFFSGSLEKGKYNSDFSRIIKTNKGEEVLKYDDNQIKPSYFDNVYNSNRAVFSSGKLTSDYYYDDSTEHSQILKKRKVGLCCGLENYYRTLWIYLSLVKQNPNKTYTYLYKPNVKDKTGGFKTILELYDSDNPSQSLSFFKKDWKGEYDKKKSYFNAIDIWLIFYMKFIFNVDFKKDDFKPQRGNDEIDNSDFFDRSYYIETSINECIENINKSLDDKNDIVLKLKIASELKPKLCLPLYLNINDDNKHKNKIFSKTGSGDVGKKIFGPKKSDTKPWFSQGEINEISRKVMDGFTGDNPITGTILQKFFTTGRNMSFETNFNKIKNYIIGISDTPKKISDIKKEWEEVLNNILNDDIVKLIKSEIEENTYFIRARFNKNIIENNGDIVKEITKELIDTTDFKGTGHVSKKTKNEFISELESKIGDLKTDYDTKKAAKDKAFKENQKAKKTPKIGTPEASNRSLLMKKRAEKEGQFKAAQQALSEVSKNLDGIKRAILEAQKDNNNFNFKNIISVIDSTLESENKKTLISIFENLKKLNTLLNEYSKQWDKSLNDIQTLQLIRRAMDSVKVMDKLKYSVHKPIPGLWHEPLTLSSIDFFMAINGIVSPFDIKSKTPYWLPPTNFSDEKQLTETVKIMNYSIKIFDNMMCKVKKSDNGSDREKKICQLDNSEVLNIWIKLRDTYIIKDEYKWTGDKMCGKHGVLNKPINDRVSPLISDKNAFADHWINGGIKESGKRKFPDDKEIFNKDLVLQFNYYKYPKLNDNSKTEKLYSLEYLYSTIMDFILNYITLIVNQGDGIVATLDHLAVFFKNPNLKTHGINTGSKELVEENIDIISEKRSPDAGLHFMMYNTLRDLKNNDTISKYVMLTAIKRGEISLGKNIDTEKYCLAAHNTLHFAQRVTAKANACKCDISTLPKIYPIYSSLPKGKSNCQLQGGGDCIVFNNNDTLVKFLNKLAKVIELSKNNKILINSNLGIPFGNLFNLNINFEDIDNNTETDKFNNIHVDDISNNNILNYGLKVNDSINSRLSKHRVDFPYISVHYKDESDFARVVQCIKKATKKFGISNVYLMTQNFNIFYELTMELPKLNIFRKTIPYKIIKDTNKFKEMSEIMIDLYMILRSEYFIPANNSSKSSFIMNMIHSNQNIFDFNIKTKIINC